MAAAASNISDIRLNDYVRDALRSGQRRRSCEAGFAEAAPPPMGRRLGVEAAPMSQRRARGFAFMLLLYNGF